MADTVFTSEGGRFIPTEHARGPWDPRALHGGAPAALIATAFERMEPASPLRIARLSFEFLRPIPLAPLTLATQVVRSGRRVQELSAQLTSAADADGRASGDAHNGAAGEQLTCRASALRVLPVPPEAAACAAHAREAQPAGSAPTRMKGPDAGRPVQFALGGDPTDASFGATS